VNKTIFALVLTASAIASADPAPLTPVTSPWGTSPNVVTYAPPAVSDEDHTHHGITLEASLFAGTTSRDTSAAGGSFGIGLWVTEPVSLMFRFSRIGEFGFFGASLQYEPKTSQLWGGVGIGQMLEATMDEYGYADHVDGTGGFARIGYNIVQGNPHALYLSGELQAGNIEDRTRVVGVVAIGYQLL
jgi:hypothetical protein